MNFCSGPRKGRSKFRCAHDVLAMDKSPWRRLLVPTSSLRDAQVAGQVQEFEANPDD